MRPHVWWALGIAVASAGCGGNAGPVAPLSTPTPPPPTTTLPPATLADLSASAASPEANRKINCRREFNVVVTLTNRAQTPVSVSGVRKLSRVTSGDCFAGGDFTYRPAVNVVEAGTTATLMNRPLYTGGTGCCVDPRRCGGVCSFEERLTVVTNVGDVPAGSLFYRLEFGPNCDKCDESVAASGRDACGPLRP